MTTRFRKVRSPWALKHRRLAAESLESRLCLSAVRIVTWNTENGPDGAADEAYFSTVFEAIGNETVQGNTLRPSIIALQETDNLQFGGNSIARVDAILESLYPQTTYDYAVTTLDSGDDANGFVYDTGIFELVSMRVVPPTDGMQAFAHNNLRGQFRPVGTTGSSDFFLYTTHLKAGSDVVDINRRTAEAAAIRADIDALGSNQDVVVMGDFNIAGSSEGAYQNFLAGGNGRLFDPIDSPGQWKNNPAFRAIHTQNPEINGAGGMDDRFDFQLGSSALFDSEGLQYIDGSYRAFGNNGTHTFNSDITTGTGASIEVLAALAAASDHLPVVVDYNVDIDLAGFSIIQTDATTTVTEAGAGDSYSVVLDAIPTADVAITVTTDGQTHVNGVTSTTLVFTPADALIPKTVDVTAVDDQIGEGNHVGQITHSASSSDAQFNSLQPAVLTVSIVDNDRPNVVISEIMYNPASSEPDSEWVELVNLGPGPVDISGWLLDDEDAETNWSAVPLGTPSLAVGNVVVVHNAVISSEIFRSRWSVPASSQVIGVTWGSLANGPSAVNEILELRDAKGGIQDAVNYDDDGVNWPADNNRSSIYLPDASADNDLGSSWRLSVIGVDGAVNPDGAPFDPSDVGSPGLVAGLNLDPPQIVETRFDDNKTDDDQRSMLRSVTLVFDQVVSLSDAAVKLVKRGIDNPAAASVAVSVSLNDSGGRSEVRLTFAGNHVDPKSGSLLDGGYILSVNASQVISQSNGLVLDGDRDDEPGGDVVIGERAEDAFFRFFGDSDGDRDVDAQDYGRLASTFQRTSGQAGFNAAFDGDGDGDVDSLDLGRFRLRFGRSLSQ